jgi:hypothetical protein
VRLGSREVPIQACALVDEGRCTGLLLILETTGTPVVSPENRQPERPDPDAGLERGPEESASG